jgi:tRNA A-37 threonylcarbamoyl transferase component Bud32
MKHVKNKLKADEISFASFGGADINFYLKKDKKVFAMMRLGIIDKNINNNFINRFDKEKRLTKEIYAYENCSDIEVTPDLLFSDENCTVCKFIDGLSAEKYLETNKIDIYTLYELILKQYLKMHEKDITHLDATLKNIFYDEISKCFKIVDFEYYPNEEFNIKKQKLYDYLRITDYLLRKNELNNQKLIEILNSTVLFDYSDLDISNTSKFLNKLNTIEEFKTYLYSKNIKI